MITIVELEKLFCGYECIKIKRRNAEERRLFYVAMTRTKNRVYFIAPEQNPSEFLLEIKHDYKNVVLKYWKNLNIKGRYIYQDLQIKLLK